MTREEMENFINAPLNMELYEKFKIIYDKGYQDCKKEIKGCKSISISDSQKKLIEIYNEINESENAVCYLTSDDSDVIQSAIKALQEPCEDCIRRQAVFDINKSHRGQMPDHINHQIWQEVKNLPSVQPKPKTGHWIMSDDGLYRPICDKCGAHPWKGYIPTVEEATEVFNYCPKCGVKMEIGDIEE